MPIRYNYSLMGDMGDNTIEVEFECRDCGYIDSAICAMYTLNPQNLLYDIGWEKTSAKYAVLDDFTDEKKDDVLCPACYAKEQGILIDYDEW